MLSSELSETQQQLAQKTDLATQLQRELTKTKMELQQGNEARRKEEGELRQMLHQSEVIRQSLLQQVERGSHELAATSGKLIHHQRVAAELRQYQTEVAHLQRRVRRRERGREELGRGGGDEDRERGEELGRGVGRRKRRGEELGRGVGRRKRRGEELGRGVGGDEEREGGRRRRGEEGWNKEGERGAGKCLQNATCNSR